VGPFIFIDKYYHYNRTNININIALIFFLAWFEDYSNQSMLSILL